MIDYSQNTLLIIDNTNWPIYMKMSTSASPTIFAILSHSSAGRSPVSDNDQN